MLEGNIEAPSQIINTKIGTTKYYNKVVEITFIKADEKEVDGR
jgi:hypothetical protein